MVAPSRVGLALEQFAGAIGEVGRIAAIARILGHAGNRGVIGMVCGEEPASNVVALR